MMVPKSVSWHRMIFKYHGTELPRTKWRILGVFVLSCAVTSIELYEEGDRVFDLHVVPFTLTGVALSIFLGFRNNAAYDRWWEGRKLWGALLNWTRSITRQTLTLIGQQPGAAPLTDAEKAEIRALQKDVVFRICAFAHVVRHNLRDEDDFSDLKRYVSDDEIAKLKLESNPSSAINFGTAQRIRKAYERGWLHPMHLSTLEQSLATFTDIHGGCERIKSTPIPFCYNTLIHRIVAVYCYGLPFGLVSDVGALTPIVVLVVSYAFFGIDTVGDEIEQPFGTDPNDLALTATCRRVEVDLLQRLGDEEVPPLLRPVNEILQ